MSEDKDAKVTGRYFYHQRVEDVNPAAKDDKLQDRLIDYCREVSGIALGEGAQR